MSDVITNSSSELFTFGTKSIDEVYDALETLWEDYRETPAAVEKARDARLGYVLDDDVFGIVGFRKGSDGNVNIREDEEYLLERVGFNAVIAEYFGDLVTYHGRT